MSIDITNVAIAVLAGFVIVTFLAPKSTSQAALYFHAPVCPLPLSNLSF
jgi:hypothetical protein